MHIPEWGFPGTPGCMGTTDSFNAIAPNFLVECLLTCAEQIRNINIPDANKKNR